ncbi:efflux RND transporter periplasmic adaptor subunit [Xanthomonas melonis]|uniref:Efflux RND transporter periplasmic adaptor subunit n=1 Tax=Xanthomonas melonis TaxID=56456 RepID=A0ABS8NRA0_9XANT|nr:efflux RND transporter periplasmic adaptor subunit [Xanthomonas melonis]MCD0244906.1 efflux RND transporter periplasmic adaptor subunit [Xanthomonas melonis]MCD0257212.1 efflux RND transporter periplasmic adaptor subunit [Xanthomonas melonis]MCD0265482.1 efflux RND transporter periplasmic adaptor subunit [Xanthomonas melonis]
MLRHRLVVSSVLSVLPLVLSACGGTAQPDPRTATPLVRVATVSDAVAAARSFSGTVAARVQSDLGFRVAGKVSERLVDAGQSVKRGQPLMRIDPVDLQLAARAQQDAVAAARARAQQAADDEARYRDLRGTGAISASAYDQIKAAADAAKAQLSAAQAQADVARNANRYSDLLADADGVVMETLVEPGQVVAAGQPVVRLAHAGPREAVIQLPETLRPKLGSVAQATLFGNAAVRVPATLRQLSESADRLTRTFEARYVLDGALGQAPLGTTVSLRVSDGAVSGPRAGVQVPLAALFDAGKGPGVWVIAGNPAKVSWRPVTVLGLEDDHANVAGTLARGERIVALGAHLLREGKQVRIAGAGSTATTAGTAKAAGAQP